MKDFIWEYRESIAADHDWQGAKGGATCRSIVHSMVGHTVFEFVMAVIILANTVTLGIDSELSLKGSSPAWLGMLEHCFLTIYVIEIVLQIFGMGLRFCWRSGWFRFDLVVVGSGVLYSWAARPIVDHGIGEATEGSAVLRRLTVLRVLRLLRMLRALRVVPVLRSAWKLVIGLIESWNTMASMLFLLLLFLFLFGCLGLEIIANNPDVMGTVAEHGLEHNFDSIATIMLTLVQFVTLDSCAEIYPIIRGHPVLALYFFPVVLVVSISLMNLVTAVLVEGGLTLARNNRGEKQQEKIRQIRELGPTFEAFFDEVDDTSTGTIQLLALEHMCPDSIPAAIAKITTTDTLMELYDMLEADESTQVTKSELVEALLHLHLKGNEAISGDAAILYKVIQATKNTSDDTRDVLTRMSTGLTGMDQHITLLTQAVETCQRRDPRPPPNEVVVNF